MQTSEIREAIAGIPQPSELLILQGESYLFDVKVNWKTPSVEASQFQTLLVQDQSGSIAGAVPDGLGVAINLSDPALAPDCIQAAGVFTVSNAFKQVIERFNVPNTEFFPSRLMLKPEGADWNEPWGRHGPILENYWLMNCWNRLDVIDVAQSDVEGALPSPGKKPERFVRWRRLVFKARVEADMYGFVKHMPWTKFVSSRLKDAVEQAVLRAHIRALPTQLLGR